MQLTSAVFTYTERALPRVDRPLGTARPQERELRLLTAAGWHMKCRFGKHGGRSRASRARQWERNMSPETRMLILRASELENETRELVRKHREILEQNRIEQSIQWEAIVELRRIAGRVRNGWQKHDE
jgi:hypothetical protein